MEHNKFQPPKFSNALTELTNFIKSLDTQSNNTSQYRETHDMNFIAISEEDAHNNKRDQKTDSIDEYEHKSDAPSVTIPLIQTSKQLDDFLRDQTKTFS